MKKILIIAWGLLIVSSLIAGCQTDETPDQSDDTSEQDEGDIDGNVQTGDTNSDEQVVDENINDISGLSDDIDEAESLDSLDEDLSILDEI